MSICFDCFADLREYLQNLGLFHMQLGLSRMEKALARLDLPPEPFPVIHVLGTNGKGSTSLFLQGFAAKQGLSVGLFTSPHLVDVRERIRVNGEKLGDAKWLKAGNEIVGECEDLGLTYFEFFNPSRHPCFCSGKGGSGRARGRLGGEIRRHQRI